MGNGKELPEEGLLVRRDVLLDGLAADIWRKNGDLQPWILRSPCIVKQLLPVSSRTLESSLNIGAIF